MSQNITADDRSADTKIEMAQHFAEERATYVASDSHTIVYEDDQVAIVADHNLHDLNEWASSLGVDREELRATMRALADTVLGEREAHEAFSYSDPVVFDKLE